MRTAVFGGTFNPPHLGHIKLARAVIAGNYADKILFIPAFRPPHKTGHSPAPFTDRVNMLQLALRDFAEAEISTLEERRPDRLSYTFDTMTELTEAAPQTEFLLLIGGDSLAQLHQWYRARELAEKWLVLTYPRPGNRVELSDLCRDWPEHLAAKLVKGIMEMPFFDISSTAVRDALSGGRAVKNILDAEVMKYIEEKRLYR